MNLQSVLLHSEGMTHRQTHFTTLDADVFFVYWQRHELDACR